MYAYMIGNITDLSINSMVIEVNHIGYNIRISAKTAEELSGMREEIKVYTYTSVREDAINLYGFLSKEELDFFILLLNVSGIGPKGAQAILSVMEPNDLRFAIISGDSKLLAKAPGVGKKTAERIILDLKDKVSLDDVLGNNSSLSGEISSISTSTNEVAKEAIEALIALGYGQSEATKAVNLVSITNEMDSGDIMKLALKMI